LTLQAVLLNLLDSSSNQQTMKHSCNSAMRNFWRCCCVLQVYRDPVITPSGFSYERSALLEHLARVGKFDPISRSPMTESDVTANVGLRNATQHYLDEHPWAWQECV
jgi:hypothetical protein